MHITRPETELVQQHMTTVRNTKPQRAGSRTVPKSLNPMTTTVTECRRGVSKQMNMEKFKRNASTNDQTLLRLQKALIEGP
eukprot:3589906-Amphidinium_carterae.1